MIRRGFRGNKTHQHRNEKKSDTVKISDESNPVIKAFRGYASELDDKHDRYERIVKFSRDITVESKRLIFLLHTVDLRNPNSTKTLSDALVRLNSLCTNSFASIAKELEGRDPYQYARAFSAGLQEFVEAFTYYDYLCNDSIMDWTDIQKKLTYALELEDSSEATATETDNCSAPAATKELTCLVQPVEFMLGLADLSGEVMRKCINSLGSGDIDTCRKACNFIQHLYSG